MYMGFYAITLAGSNYVGPVIMGFVAEYQGWRWVFYWSSIFMAFTLVFLFLFMEETSYLRKRTAPGHADGQPTSAEGTSTSKGISGTDLEKATAESDDTTPGSPARIGEYKKKTYLQKLALLGPRKQKNNMLRRAGQMLYYLSWPVVFYAGYSDH